MLLYGEWIVFCVTTNCPSFMPGTVSTSKYCELLFTSAQPLQLLQFSAVCFSNSMVVLLPLIRFIIPASFICVCLNMGKLRYIYCAGGGVCGELPTSSRMSFPTL